MSANQFLALFIKSKNEYEAKEMLWVESLLLEGFKAAHPNDGWVNREMKTLRLNNPYFNKGIKVGDKIMLGWHYDEKSKQAVVVTKVENVTCAIAGIEMKPVYSFEYVQQ